MRGAHRGPDSTTVLLLGLAAGDRNGGPIQDGTRLVRGPTNNLDHQYLDHYHYMHSNLAHHHPNKSNPGRL